MAILLIDGAEGRNSETSGWIYRPPGASTGNPRKRIAEQAAGAGTWFVPQNISATLIGTRKFPWNADAGRRVRLREAYLGHAYWNSDLLVTSALSQHNQIGFANDEWRRSIGHHTLTQQSRLYRGGSFLLQTSTPGTGQRYRSNTYWLGAFSADVDGWVWVTDGRGTKTYNSFTGDTAPGTGGPFWYDSLQATRATGFNNFDDMVVIAPSISVTLQGQPVLAMDDDVVGTTSGASAKVSDFEPSKGRIWLHSWNDQPWQDGETLVDGSSNVIGVLNAPNAAFVNGFEPWSYPQWNLRGVPFVLATSPQQDIAPTELTPVGDPNNVDNINAVPENPATLNENTTSGALSDTYGGYAALPGWVDTVVAVEPEGDTLAEGPSTVSIAVTDATGTQAVTARVQASAPRVPAAFATRADASVWSAADITALSVTFTLDPT